MALQLTQFQLALITVILLAVILFFFLGILYVRRKYPEKKQIDPFTRAFIIVFGIDSFLVLSYAVVDVPSKEQLTKILPYSALLFILLVLIFLVIIYWNKKEISTKKLWENYVLPAVDWKWQGRIYRGAGYVPSYKFSKVISVAENPLLRESKNVTNKAEVFYGAFISHTIFKAIVVLNKYNGNELFSQHNPSLDIVLNLLGREAKNIYTDYGQEFEQGNINTQQEKEIEVQRR